MYEKPPTEGAYMSTPSKQAYHELLIRGRNRYEEFLNYIELTKKFRQINSQAFGETLGRCRLNLETESDLELLNSRFISDQKAAIAEVQSKADGICLATTKIIVNESNVKAFQTLTGRGNRSIQCYASHRVTTPRTRARRTQEEQADVDVDEGEDAPMSVEENNITDTDNQQATESGLTVSERRSCLLHDPKNVSLTLVSCLRLAVGTRVMLTSNVDAQLGLVNGTTGTVVGFVYCTASGSKNIIENPENLNEAAQREPQLPVVLMQVDQEFWKSSQDHGFAMPAPVLGMTHMERTIAVPPINEFKSFYIKVGDSRKKFNEDSYH
jgi:hypothetical protein